MREMDGNVIIFRINGAKSNSLFARHSKVVALTL